MWYHTHQTTRLIQKRFMLQEGAGPPLFALPGGNRYRLHAGRQAGIRYLLCFIDVRHCQKKLTVEHHSMVTTVTGVFSSSDVGKQRNSTFQALTILKCVTGYNRMQGECIRATTLAKNWTIGLAKFLRYPSKVEKIMAKPVIGVHLLTSQVSGAPGKSGTPRYICG